MSTSALGNLVRIVPLELSDLPPHPSIPQQSQAASTTTPSDSRLITFLLAILDEASTFISPSTFSTTFTSLSTKSSPPSASPVEVYKREISASDVSSIQWSANQRVPREPPAKVEDENWFARRSVHKNEPSKTSEGSASWSEFVFGLKEQHSKHEQDFTPTLYDAHYVLDWNEEIRNLPKQGGTNEDWIEGENGIRYTDITMEIFEMCHSLPGPLGPRCFPVLVLTAFTSPTSFLAVTVPVNLLSPAPLEAAYYSTGRNATDPSASEQQQKRPVVGVYAAVETVKLLGNGEGEEGGIEVRDGDGRDIEWIMAMASDAKGNLPMFLQKPNLPSAVAKDVGLFMQWIKGVDVEKERQGGKDVL
ncbi:hypothetical protein EPUS_07657 [Endocarpon pusillum Z07020]|uniref:DUF3074 domain-containing protein n=1 Tax=Endocarpon pusillum (strain Z07020 / HMAS-L-300199) TaxID=1263415 RepID=U1GYA6_ENDPU|nr:uncharacterized protein EPUS_07657 [Endocarpon pusillum Z07020]ERF77116.1 hypothetical protein EPUS_07657 [Endocarpon pusillum Z07020]